MGRRPGSKNKKTLERERNERIASLEEQMRSAADRRDGQPTEHIERELAELRGTVFEEDDGDESVTNENMEDVLSKPLDESALASLTSGVTGNPMGDPVEPVVESGAPENQPMPEEPATAQPATTLPSGGAAKAAEREKRPRKGGKDIKAKRREAALKLGGLIDMVLDQVTHRMGSTINTRDIQTGANMVDGVPRGLPYDINLEADSMAEMMLSTFEVDGKLIHCTPGQAIAYNLAGQGAEVTVAIQKFIEENEETIRVGGAVLIAGMWCTMAFKESRAIRAEQAKGVRVTPSAPSASPQPTAPPAMMPEPAPTDAHK